MALEPKISISETDDSSKILLWDSTGVYSTPDNEGGFGAPNPEINDVTSVELRFQFDLISNPLIFNFIVLNGVVQSGEFIDELGNVNQIDLNDLNVSAYPFPENSKVEIASTFINPNMATFADQYVEITYSVTALGNTDSQEKIFLLDKASCCCLKKAVATNAGEKCGNIDTIEIFNAATALQWQNSNGYMDKARETIKLLNKLCKGCGCGC